MLIPRQRVKFSIHTHMQTPSRELDAHTVPPSPFFDSPRGGWGSGISPRLSTIPSMSSSEGSKRVAGQASRRGSQTLRSTRSQRPVLGQRGSGAPAEEGPLIATAVEVHCCVCVVAVVDEVETQWGFGVGRFIWFFLCGTTVLDSLILFYRHISQLRMLFMS